MAATCGGQQCELSGGAAHHLQYVCHAGGLQHKLDGHGRGV